MKVLIIEDEHLAAIRLESLIKRYDKSIEVVANTDSIKSSVAYLSKNTHPDLAFFDIQLGDGLSFEIFDKIDLKCPVIFTTAYDEYALKAFKVNSIDYLLKPIDFEELKTALNKFKSLGELFINAPSANSIQESFRDVMNALSGKKFKEHFLVRHGSKMKSINVQEVSCFLSEHKGSFIGLKEGSRFTIDLSLDRIETLIDPSIFYRISRKYLINRSAIGEIVSYSGNRLKVLLDGRKENDVIVSRERASDFKAWLGG